MSRPYKRDLLCFCLLTSLVVAAGCGGTETGNPAPPVPVRPPNAAMALMNTMCDKLTACRPDVDLSRCRSAVSANEAMPSDLGLQPGSYNVYVDVMTAVDTKELNANQEALDACEATIQQYACTDEHVVDVNFFGTCNSNVEKMVDTEPGAGCPRVFAGQ